MPIVDLDTRKWGDHPHWRFDTTELLGRDDHGTWLGLEAGTSYTGPRGAGAIEHGFVCLIPDGEWWGASFHSETNLETDVYVDVATPARWTSAAHVTMIDLDLDVIRDREGVVKLDDEDEFEDHLVLYRYPDDVIRRARSTAEWLMEAVESEREPFGSASHRWLETLTRQVNT